MLLVGVDNCLSSQTQSSPLTTSPSEKLRGELSLSAVTAEVTRGLGRQGVKSCFLPMSADLSADLCF